MKSASPTEVRFGLAGPKIKLRCKKCTSLRKSKRRSQTTTKGVNIVLFIRLFSFPDFHEPSNSINCFPLNKALFFFSSWLVLSIRPSFWNSQEHTLESFANYQTGKREEEEEKWSQIPDPLKTWVSNMKTKIPWTILLTGSHSHYHSRRRDHGWAAIATPYVYISSWQFWISHFSPCLW